MGSITYKPQAPLSAFVEEIRLRDGSGPSRQRVLPAGRAALAFNLKERPATWFKGDRRETVQTPLLVGPYTTPFWVNPADNEPLLAVLFKPGAFRVFFPLALQELHNIDVALEDVYPHEARQLTDLVLSAPNHRARFMILEEFLIAKLAGARQPHPAVNYAVRQFVTHRGTRTVADVQAEVGLSHTRFIRLFHEAVGLTPKLFCRVQRFRAVVDRTSASGMSIDWAQVAATCGYFDQAHLIRDFQEFSGISPAAFVLSART